MLVRDRPLCTSPDEIFDEIVEHIKVASSGHNIRSVMTIFRPRRRDETWGVKFWNSQFVRYAGYKNPTSDEILGDAENVGFTSYLIDHNLWKPPAEKSAFDVLPIVIKIPGNDTPIAYELPASVNNEILIEHPEFPEVKKLGYKWTAIPALSNFSVMIGGIEYTAAQFNGWFVTTEIARNLLERYEALKPLATAMDFDPTDKFLAQRVSIELEAAILYSFEKRNVTIVDPATVGHSFITHCKRTKCMERMSFKMVLDRGSCG